MSTFCSGRAVEPFCFGILSNCKRHNPRRLARRASSDDRQEKRKGRSTTASEHKDKSGLRGLHNSLATSPKNCTCGKCTVFCEECSPQTAGNCRCMFTAMNSETKGCPLRHNRCRRPRRKLQLWHPRFSALSPSPVPVVAQQRARPTAPRTAL